MRQTWELLIGWCEMVIRVLRTRRNPHQLVLPLLPTIHQLTNTPTMSRSNLRDAAPFLVKSPERQLLLGTIASSLVLEQIVLSPTPQILRCWQS